MARPRPQALPDRLTAEEREVHARFVAGELGGDADLALGRLSFADLLVLVALERSRIVRFR